MSDDDAREALRRLREMAREDGLSLGALLLRIADAEDRRRGRGKAGGKR